MTSKFEFEVGDVVRLKGHLIPMIVENRVYYPSGNKGYRCIFFDVNNNLHKKEIVERCLVKVSDNEKNAP